MRYSLPRTGAPPVSEAALSLTAAARWGFAPTSVDTMWIGAGAASCRSYSVVLINGDPPPANSSGARDLPLQTKRRRSRPPGPLNRLIPTVDAHIIRHLLRRPPMRLHFDRFAIRHLHQPGRSLRSVAVQVPPSSLVAMASSTRQPSS
jgi:hypothetical protein